MPVRKRRFDPALKARIALEALRGRTPISTLAEQYAMHPNQIHAWKKQLQDQAFLIFDRRIISLSPAPIEDSRTKREYLRKTRRGSQDVRGQGPTRSR
jgi:transposase-like protein